MVGGKPKIGHGFRATRWNCLRQLVFSFASFASLGGSFWDGSDDTRRIFFDEEVVQAHSAGAIAESRQEDHFLARARAEKNDFRKQVS